MSNPENQLRFALEYGPTMQRILEINALFEAEMSKMKDLVLEGRVDDAEKLRARLHDLLDDLVDTSLSFASLALKLGLIGGENGR